MQLPFIKHGGKLIPDSAFIIKYLSATFPEKVVKLSPEQQAQAAALTALLDYRFSCAMIYCRWMRPEVIAGPFPLVILALPSVLRPTIVLCPCRGMALHAWDMHLHSSLHTNCIVVDLFIPAARSLCLVLCETYALQGRF